MNAGPGRLEKVRALHEHWDRSYAKHTAGAERARHRDRLFAAQKHDDLAARALKLRTSAQRTVAKLEREAAKAMTRQANRAA